MSGLLREVTPDNFYERTFEVRPPRVKLWKVIASANRNCLPELVTRALCLQLLSLLLTHCAMFLFAKAWRYRTPSLRSGSAAFWATKGKCTREKRTAFCPVLYTKTTKNYGCLSLNCGTILASHSTVPRPYRQLALAVLLAPPSDPFGIYEVWGSICFHFCPSPGSLRDQQGVGHQEVEVILARFL